MPAVLWVHGGAWVGGEVHPNKAAWLATRGYFTASVEYRLAKVSHTDGPKWPSQIQDCKLAVRWLRANAARYHVDPDHIGIWGESAGGHLVSCVGTLDDPALEQFAIGTAPKIFSEKVGNSSPLPRFPTRQPALPPAPSTTLSAPSPPS
jgi:acetyl esterase/lipase